jgi:hypothetical protein
MLAHREPEHAVQQHEALVDAAGARRGARDRRLDDAVTLKVVNADRRGAGPRSAALAACHASSNGWPLCFAAVRASSNVESGPMAPAVADATDELRVGAASPSCASTRRDGQLPRREKKRISSGDRKQGSEDGGGGRREPRASVTARRQRFSPRRPEASDRGSSIRCGLGTPRRHRPPGTQAHRLCRPRGPGAGSHGRRHLAAAAPSGPRQPGRHRGSYDPQWLGAAGGWWVSSGAHLSIASSVAGMWLNRSGSSGGAFPKRAVTRLDDKRRLPERRAGGG